MNIFLTIFFVLMVGVYSAQTIDKSVQPSSGASIEDQPDAIQNQFNQYFQKRNAVTDKKTKEISSKDQLELNKLVDQTKAIEPQSFQYYYLEYVNQGRTIEAFPFLQKAEAVYPDNAELYDDFVYHYELINDDGKKYVYCKKLYESNTIPSGIMEYNYNVLMSLDKNSILITNGSDDTYPIFIWQEIKKVRPDVQVINLDMAAETSYLNSKASESNLKISKGTSKVATILNIIKENESKNIYLGHTVSQKILEELQNDLYLTGLTYKYSKSPIDNIEGAVEKFEDNFKLDQLERGGSSSQVNQLNFNYSLPLITFLEYYKQTQNTKKYNETRDLLLLVAKRVNKESFITEYLNQKNL